MTVGIRPRARAQHPGPADRQLSGGGMRGPVERDNRSRQTNNADELQLRAQPSAAQQGEPLCTGAIARRPVLVPQYSDAPRRRRRARVPCFGGRGGLDLCKTRLHPWRQVRGAARGRRGWMARQLRRPPGAVVPAPGGRAARGGPPAAGGSCRLVRPSRPQVHAFHAPAAKMHASAGPRTAQLLRFRTAAAAVQLFIRWRVRCKVARHSARLRSARVGFWERVASCTGHCMGALPGV